MKKSTQLSTRRLAAELGLSQTAIQKQRRRGLSDAEIRESAHRRSELSGPKAGGAAVTLSDIVRRKELATAELRELELRRQRGELVEVDAIEAQWTDIATSIRDSMLAIPTRVAGRLAGMTNEASIVVALRKEIRAVLQRVSMTIANGGDGPEAVESPARSELTKGENV